MHIILIFLTKHI